MLVYLVSSPALITVSRLLLFPRSVPHDCITAKFTPSTLPPSLWKIHFTFNAFSLHLSKHTCLKRLLPKQRIIQTALQGLQCLSLCLDLGTSGLGTRASERREWQGNTCPLGPCFCHLCSSRYPGGTTSSMKSSALVAEIQHSPLPGDIV